MDWSEVHDEAERLEHAISENLLERIDDMLGHPAVDPHGDPIPDAERPGRGAATCRAWPAAPWASRSWSPGCATRRRSSCAWWRSGA